MRVVDIVIGEGWVILWVGWFAAAAGVKPADPIFDCLSACPVGQFLRP
jgi:hypothetical protein